MKRSLNVLIGLVIGTNGVQSTYSTLTGVQDHLQNVTFTVAGVYLCVYKNCLTVMCILALAIVLLII